MRLRRSIAALLITTLTLLLTSCGGRTEIGVELWDENTVTLDVDVSVPNGVNGVEFNPLYFCQSLMIMGQKLDPYVEDGRAGCRTAGPVPSEVFDINDASGLTREDGKLTLALEDPLGTFDVPTEIRPEEWGLPPDTEIPEEFAEPEIAFHATFPGKVLEHSGSSTVEGRTVTWSELDDFHGTVSATSVMPSRLLVPILFIIGGLALFSGAIVWWFTTRESTTSGPQGAPAGAPPPSGH